MNRKPLILGGLAGAVVVVGVLGWATWRFGSLAGAASYFGGRPVLVDGPVRDLGSVKCNEQIEVAFRLTNLQREPLEIVGAECSCSCVLPPQMPIVLEGSDPTSLVLNFHTPPTPMDFEEVIDVLFNGPYPPLQLKIVGTTK